MKKIFYVLLVAFLLIQVFQIDKTLKPVDKGMDFLIIKNTPEPIASTIKNACYDCHSNETKYPWYSYVQPFGWFLNSHIEEGRRKLNFSTFSTYDLKRQAHKMEESVEMVEKGYMPLDSYTMIHGDAKLSPQQRKDLAEYFKMIQTEYQQAIQH